jgi:hypothetical protein
VGELRQSSCVKGKIHAAALGFYYQFRLRAAAIQCPVEYFGIAYHLALNLMLHN